MTDTPEQRGRFAALITGISDYYGKKISSMSIDLYWRGLLAYDFEAIERAMWEHTQTPDECGRWMPTISDLAKVMQGRTVDQAQLAWSKVDKAVRTVGIYSDIVFDDALIHVVLSDMGGWIAINNKPDKDWPFVAKDFETRYRGYRMRAEKPKAPRVLVGMANAHNATEGLLKLPARLFGDEEKAREVAEGDNPIGIANIPLKVGES